MARKRRAPSPPPPQESSTDSGPDTDEEELSRRAAAQAKALQNHQPHPPTAAADGADSSGEESDSDADAFLMRPVSHPGSDADEASESEPEVPEPVQKKAAATTKKSKTAVPEDKKRPAPEPAPSGRAKKTKAETGKAAPEATPAGKSKKANAEREKAEPEATPSGKGKKANAEREKAAPDATPAGKGKKAKKPMGKPENPELDPSPPSKSARAPHKWSKEDLIRILEAMVAHVKTEAALPNTHDLLAAVRDRLDRKNCTYTDMYEKVRRFKERYEKAVANGVVPTGEDELQIYNLSEAIWGEKAKEAMAAAAAAAAAASSQKGKKGQVKKEKSVGNSKGSTVSEVPNQSGDTKKGSKKGHAAEVKTNKDVKSELSKEDTTAASPSKSKKLLNGKQEFRKDAKSGTSKETTTSATQNGDALTKRKREKMDIDLKPEEASTGGQNSGAQIEENTHQAEAEIGASAEGMHRSFDELQDLYPCLAGCVKSIEAESSCGETLKRAFGFIGDEKADALESKIKAHRLLELKAQIRQEAIQKEILNMLISLED